MKLSVMNPDEVTAVVESRDVSVWTPQENATFEKQLSFITEGDPERWSKISDKVSTKTEGEVRAHFERLFVDAIKIEIGIDPTQAPIR